MASSYWVAHLLCVPLPHTYTLVFLSCRFGSLFPCDESFTGIHRYHCCHQHYHLNEMKKCHCYCIIASADKCTIFLFLPLLLLLLLLGRRTRACVEQQWWGKGEGGRGPDAGRWESKERQIGTRCRKENQSKSPGWALAGGIPHACFSSRLIFVQLPPSWEPAGLPS